MMTRAREGEYHAVVEELSANFVHPSRRGDERLGKITRDMADDVGIEGFVRQQTAMIARPDSRPTLTAIRCPTLVLTSDTDNMIPNSLSTEMADEIAGSSLVVLDDCGHLPQLEQPEETAQALLEWLRG
jgi:pimeloyl-ACP methyl ester carboxylesterase